MVAQGHPSGDEVDIERIHIPDGPAIGVPVVARTHTHAHVNLFSIEDVDRLFGEASRTLESDWVGRRDHLSARNRNAGDARIKALHALWAMFLEPAPDQ